MKERLVAFLFLAVLLSFAYHFVFAKTYQQLFSTSSALQVYWYVPFIIVPALLLVVLAWIMGLARRSNPAWASLTVVAVIAAVTFLTLDAPYSCVTGCF